MYDTMVGGATGTPGSGEVVGDGRSIARRRLRDWLWRKGDVNDCWSGLDGRTGLEKSLGSDSQELQLNSFKRPAARSKSINRALL